MKSRCGRRGGALLVSLFVALGVAGLMSAYFALSMVEARATDFTVAGLRALYAAEAGAAANLIDFNAGGGGITAGIFGGGEYTVDVQPWGSDEEDNDEDGLVDEEDEEDYIRLDCTGLHSEETERVEVMLRRSPGGIYWNAVFAGNSSEDSDYSLPFGGRGREADHIIGDVYSGGDIGVTGDALLDSDQVMATGNVTGYEGYVNGRQSIPDLQAMNYETIADHDVKAIFDREGQLKPRNRYGGSAVEVGADSPAHIFRKNPSDRPVEIGGTVKDDYFLEDVTGYLGIDRRWDGSDPAIINLTPDGGNRAIYYVDGNLWLHNLPTFSFQMNHPDPNGVQVTFVAKGNIYFGDNLFYGNSDTDAVVFIAMKDPSVADSGNVYFGDPRGETLKVMQSFMYAENDFVDWHLAADGSKDVTLFGNMTAGNHVRINRDFGNHHSKLTVQFDDRIKTGRVHPPGLPGQPESDAGQWRIVSWRQVN